MPKEEPTNHFLEIQKRVMAQKAEIAAQRVQEAENKRVQVGAAELKDQKPFDPNAPVVVERYDAVTGEVVSTRTIPAPAARPLPVRIQKSAIRPVDSIKEDLIALGNRLDAAGETYNASSQALDEHYHNDEKAALRCEVTNLQQQLSEKQARLAELDAIKSPGAIYLDTVANAEREVAGLAGELLTSLSEIAAQRIYGVAFDRLPKDAQKACELRYLEVLAKFRLSGNYTSLGRKIDAAARQTGTLPTFEETSKRADALLDDLDSLLLNESLKENK